MKAKLSIIGMMICLLFFGCKSEKEQVRDKIEEMKSRPIELCLDKMECRRNPLSKLNKKYTMVVYVDSFSPSQIANLLGVSKQSVTNKRKKLVLLLFKSDNIKKFDAFIKALE